MTTRQSTPTFSAPASTGQHRPDAQHRVVPRQGAGRPAVPARSGRGQRRVQLLAAVPELASDARDLADRMQLTFPLLADPSLTIYREFGAFDSDDEPIACSVIITRTGTVAAKAEGVLSPSEMTAQLDDLEGSNRFEMAVNR